MCESSQEMCIRDRDKDLDCSVKGIDILLVEDIVDTGRTLLEVTKLLKNKGARDVKVVSLLDKTDRRVVEIKADYVGFEVPNEFVVGFGPVSYTHLAVSKRISDCLVD